jgi:GTP diphosphokinase / guanosine-3',5'-bis(diphosphate) 3'-diphosphatase
VDERIFVALRFVAEKHKNHRRKGGNDVPYINHPIGVATLLATVGRVTDADVLAAALLHDTVEDTNTSPQELEREFGSVISALVAEVTDDPSLKSAERKVRQEREAPFKSPKAKLIRLADKTCNVHDITYNPPPSWPLQRRIAYFDWAERVVAGLRGVNAALEAEFDATLARAREHRAV